MSTGKTVSPSVTSELLIPAYLDISGFISPGLVTGNRVGYRNVRGFIPPGSVTRNVSGFIPQDRLQGTLMDSSPQSQLQKH